MIRLIIAAALAYELSALIGAAALVVIAAVITVVTVTVVAALVASAVSDWARLRRHRYPRRFPIRSTMPAVATG